MNHFGVDSQLQTRSLQQQQPAVPGSRSSGITRDDDGGGRPVVEERCAGVGVIPGGSAARGRLGDGGARHGEGGGGESPPRQR